ncbi:hypothetical protein GJ496_006779 [Pomphorhynchus laevis]|nr:hypothetical protein GJ496_006779 [Pomphorhynchus laevis]
MHLREYSFFAFFVSNKSKIYESLNELRIFICTYLETFDSSDYVKLQMSIRSLVDRQPNNNSFQPQLSVPNTLGNVTNQVDSMTDTPRVSCGLGGNIH